MLTIYTTSNILKSNVVNKTRNKKDVVTFGGLGEFLLGHSPLLHSEVICSRPDHVRVHRRPLDTQQPAPVTPVVAQPLLLLHVPHLGTI